MNNVIRSQAFRMRKSKTFRIMIIYSFLGAFAACMMNFDSSKEQIAVTGLLSLRTAMDSEYIFMVVGIFASILLAGDFTSGGIRQIIGKGISSEQYVLGTLTSTTGFSLILLLITDVIAFLMGTAFGEGFGHISTEEWIWMVVGNLIFVYMFVALVMLVVTATRRISVTLVIALLAPSLLSVVSDLVDLATRNTWRFDPSSQLKKIISADTAFCNRLIPAVAYLAVGCLFTWMSIIEVRKRDL